MAAAWLWVGAAWRRGRAGMLAVAILCGIAGAVVVMVTAGARRASTSLDRLADTTRAADVIVNVDDLDQSQRDGIARLPMVAESGAISSVFAVVDGVEQDIGLFIPQAAHVGTTIERDRIVRGREPDPASADEVVVNEAALEATGVDVGDRITVRTLTPEQVLAEDYAPPRGPALDLRVVGVTRGAEDLLPSGEAMIRAGPALLPMVQGRVDVYATYLGVRLVPGATLEEFDEALRTTSGETARVETLSLDVRTKPAQEAISTIAIGLAVFAIVAAAASIVVVGLVVGRHLAGTANDQRVLVALGMSPSARVAALVLFAVPVAFGGAAITAAGSVLASPLMPIGLARRAEPDPGMAVDWWVVAAGCSAVAATVLAVAGLAAWRIVRSHEFGPATSTAPSQPRILANRIGAGPSAATGVELAFDRRPPAIPSKSALCGITVAVLAVTAIVTFSASLDRLLSSPERWGYPWQLKLDFTSGTVDDAATELASDSSLVDVARWDSGFSLVGDRGTRAFGLTPLRGRPGYALRSGRQPSAVDEVVLGPDTAQALGVGAGDTVEVAASAELEPAAVRVVGIALFPEIDEGDLTRGIGYFGSGFATHAAVTDLFEAYQVVVTVAPGDSLDEAVNVLGERYPGAVSGESLPTRPGGVANLTGVRRLPMAIAAFVVLLGLASLAHALGTTVRRRRHDLATLRCLGLTARQTAACIVWQSVTIGLLALAIGTPLGMIAGRAAWWAATNPIGVSPDVSRPITGLLELCAATLVAVTLLATPLAWQAGRAAPAQALRTE